MNLENIPRTIARYAYAINQSHAKVVLDPVYTLAASALLASTPPAPGIAEERVADDLFTPYRERSRKVQYFIEDWDFASARPELLTDRQRKMVQTAALGETSFAAVATFLNVYHPYPELASFFGTWLVEELNHYKGFHSYLQTMGEAWSDAKLADVSGVEFIPYSKDPFEIAACNMYQELISFLAYRSIAKQVKDPFLAKMLQQFAKDEMRHFKFYEQVVIRHMQENPDFRKVVLKVFLKTVTPLNQTSENIGETLESLKNGMYYIRKPELDFLSKKLFALVGKDMSAALTWFLGGMNPPCGVCHEETYACECELYEAFEAA